MSPCQDSPLIEHESVSSRGLVRRILFLAALFAFELIVITTWLDGDALSHGAGLIGLMRDWGAWILRYGVGFAMVFATFSYLKNKATLERISCRLAKAPIGRGFLVAHCSAMLAFGKLSALLFAGSGSRSSGYLLATSWLVAGIAAIVLAALAFLPWATWVQLVLGTGYLWAYASMAVFSACAAGNMGRWLWQPASHLSRLTFGLTKALLGPFVSGIVADPQT